MVLLPSISVCQSLSHMMQQNYILTGNVTCFVSLPGSAALLISLQETLAKVLGFVVHVVYLVRAAAKWWLEYFGLTFRFLMICEPLVLIFCEERIDKKSPILPTNLEYTGDSSKISCPELSPKRQPWLPVAPRKSISMVSNATRSTSSTFY